jgi:acyl-coenzyme A thioesterase PaaI-like protein
MIKIRFHHGRFRVSDYLLCLGAQSETMAILEQITHNATRFFRQLETGDPSVLKSMKRLGGYRLLNRLIGATIPFAARSQFQVQELRPGYLKASIPLRGNHNHFGSMYAGALFVLAEIPGGVMALFEFGNDYVPILKEMTISYHKPAVTDVTVAFQISEAELAQIKQQVDQDGKCDFTLKGELRDNAGERVAQSTGYYQLRKKGWHCGAG